MCNLCYPFGRRILDRGADFVRINQEGNGQSARPPDDVIADILSNSCLQLPHLRSSVTSPVFHKDGSLAVQQGYDPASQFYLNLGNPTDYCDASLDAGCRDVV